MREGGETIGGNESIQASLMGDLMSDVLVAEHKSGGTHEWYGRRGVTDD